MEYTNIKYNSVVQCGETGETYECNEHTGIVEPLIHDVFPKAEFQHFGKIQKVTGRNLIYIHEVYRGSTEETNVCYSMTNDTLNFAQVDTSLKEVFFRDLFARSAENLKLFTTDIVTGIKTLHKEKLYHGNLNLKTTYLCLTVGSYGSYISTFKMGGFKRKTGSNFSVMISDWQALGTLLQELERRINPIGRSNAEIHEFKDLYLSLINNNLCLDCDLNRINTVPEQSIICADFVLKHPIFLDVEEIPSYISLAIAYLEANEWTENLLTEEVFGEKYPIISLLPDNYDKNREAELLLEAELLEAELLDVGAIPCMFSNMDDPRKGFLFGKMERNLLSHQSYTSTGIIGRNIGTTSSAICAYFRTSWPDLLLAIHKAVMRTKYRSMYDYQMLLLSRITRDQLQ